MNKFFKIINMKNINHGIDTFNKLVQDFGKSMDTMTREMSADIEKSNKNSEAREKKNKENLDKIWGRKDWGVKFVKSLTGIQVDFSHGKNKFVDYVVEFVSTFLGMGIIFRSIGKYELPKL